jgi:CBS-domain-containing membrane protein
MNKGLLVGNQESQERTGGYLNRRGKMIQLKKFPPATTGPFRKDINWKEVAISLIGHAAIGIILAVSVVGMAGGFDEEKPMTMACVSCAGGVGR